MNWGDFVFGILGGVLLAVLTATLIDKWGSAEDRRRELEFEIEQGKEWRHAHCDHEIKRYEREVAPLFRRVAALENKVFPPQRRKSDAKAIKPEAR